MATKFLTINPWLALRSASASWRETVGWCVHVYVSYVWLDCCFYSVPSQDLVGFLFVCLFVCLFQTLDLVPYLPRTIEALSIPNPWTDISTPLRVARQTSPMWPPFVGSIWQVCSQKVGPSAEYVHSGGFGGNWWSCPLSNGACLANKPVCEFWLSVLSKLWWLELRKNKARAGIKKDLRLFCLWKKSYVLGSSGLWEGVWTTLLFWLSRMEQ